jgi:2-haloacid dehalogenase
MKDEPDDDTFSGADNSVEARVTARPSLLIFDVNETLSNMAPMGQRFEDIGAPAHLATTWFAALLRDGFALTCVDDSEPFARIAAEGLRIALHGIPLSCGLEDAVEHVMAGFAGLSVHPDVPDGIRNLAGLGIRLVTLSNGSTSVAEALLERAGISGVLETLLSVEDAAPWKPAQGAYTYALERCGVASWEAMLVAVHPWDIDGAARAGLATAWINRVGGPYPAYFKVPGLSARSLAELAELAELLSARSDTSST